MHLWDSFGVSVGRTGVRDVREGYPRPCGPESLECLRRREFTKGMLLPESGAALGEGACGLREGAGNARSRIVQVWG